MPCADPDPHSDPDPDPDADADGFAHANRLTDADAHRLAESEPEYQPDPALSRPARSGTFAGGDHPPRDGLKRWEPMGGGSCAAGCHA